VGTADLVAKMVAIQVRTHLVQALRGNLIAFVSASVACVVLLFCASNSAGAQPGQLPLLESMPLQRPPMFDPTEGMIRIDVEIRDQSGKTVAGLSRRDFKVEDNGQPVKIVSFQASDQLKAEPDPLMEVILVIDELNMGDSPQLLAAEREAQNFVRQQQGSLAGPVMIYRVSKHGLSASVYTTQWNGDSLADEIGSRREPRTIWKTPPDTHATPRPVSKTTITSNMTRSLQALGAIAIEERRRPGRKLLFWLGPGWQTNAVRASGLFDAIKEFSTRLREARISLWEATEWLSKDTLGNALPISDFVDPKYLAGVKPDIQDIGYLALNVLAIQCGGGLLATKKDLSGVISQRIEESREFYSLTFDPQHTEQMDEYHRLEVECAEPDLSARTRAGYFDEPVYYDQPNAMTERVTVEQFKQILNASGKDSDAQLEKRLSSFELSERLDGVDLGSVRSSLRGRRSRQALAALADQSAFLDPPASMILPTTAPNSAMQMELITRAVEFTRANFPRMPDFLADRTRTFYSEAEPNPAQTWKTDALDRSLHAGQTTNASVAFRNGKEVVTGEISNGKQVGSLETIGTFGPVLLTMLAGATTAQSELTWSHWEQGESGPEAVFRYYAMQEKPLYTVEGEYIATDDTIDSFQKGVPFHGEFAVDSKNGAILRLTMQAGLVPRLPLDQSSLMVEYGPTLIGGTTYICPLRSVSFSRLRRVVEVQEWGESFKSMLHTERY
jgi:VWFA-related protein